MVEGTNFHIIDPRGDLVLHVRQNEGDKGFLYRIASGTLKQSSRYFENLLSDRFNEGRALSDALEALKLSGCTSPADAASDVLPRISIVHVGRISNVSSIQNLFADFLRALHALPLAVPPPIANLANLAVVADRFDALPALAGYVERKKYIQAAEAKAKTKVSSSGLPEERVRQKLLVGVFLHHAPWVTTYSKHLILRDSTRWQPDVDEDDSLALWWAIPGGVEDELIARRQYILETINSLQCHFLALYTSGDRQCRLGYDSSPQCDAFQLGEMIRFFLRVGTLRLQGTIYDPAEPTYYQGDIRKLLESLRQVSAYQIDRNHAHCGLRAKLIPLLDMLDNRLRGDNVGICMDCWVKERGKYAWALAKRPVSWTPGRPGFGGLAKERKESLGSEPACLARHLELRDMFMATQKEWTVG